MRSSFRKLALAGLATGTIVLGSIGAAQAAGGHWGGGHGGHWGGDGHWGGGWGGFGAGLAGGLALGAIAGGPYWAGYGPYAYEPYGYDSGPDCYLRRRIVIDRFGRRLIRHVRVCY